MGESYISSAGEALRNFSSYLGGHRDDAPLLKVVDVDGNRTLTTITRAEYLAESTWLGRLLAWLGFGDVSLCKVTDFLNSESGQSLLQKIQENDEQTDVARAVELINRKVDIQYQRSTIGLFGIADEVSVEFFLSLHVPTEEKVNHQLMSFMKGLKARMSPDEYRFIVSRTMFKPLQSEQTVAAHEWLESFLESKLHSAIPEDTDPAIVGELLLERLSPEHDPLLEEVARQLLPIGALLQGIDKESALNIVKNALKELSERKRKNLKEFLQVLNQMASTDQGQSAKSRVIESLAYQVAPKLISSSLKSEISANTAGRITSYQSDIHLATVVGFMIQNHKSIL